MPVIKISPFDGQFPRKGDYQLGDLEARIAQNVKLYNGELRSWRAPTLVENAPLITLGAQTIYRLEKPDNLDSQWLSWLEDVDVANSVIGDTTDGRIYYTGQVTPRKTNFLLATSGPGPYPTDYQELGVPFPTNAPTVVSTGGTGGVQARVYVYTYVNTFGTILEESAPSQPTTVESQVTGATVTVSGLGTAAPAGKYNITHKRIYRTIGGDTSLDYRLVAEIPITQDSYADAFDDADIPGDPLISLEFTPPPFNLRGLVEMSGSFLAGFVGNEVWFSEPNYPHAWPSKYVLTVESRIVGLGVVGNLLVVMTVKSPEIIYGNTPDALGQERIPLIEPCASKRSITTDGDAVMYASPNGLVAIGPGQRQRFTDRLFRRTEFQRYEPSSLYGVIYDGQYVLWHDSADLGQGGFFISPSDVPAMSSVDFFTRAAFIDKNSAQLFYVNEDNKLVEFDSSPINNVEFLWRSKKFDLPFPVSMGALQLYADYEQIAAPVVTPDEDIAYNQNLIDTDQVLGYLNSVEINALGYPLNGTNLITPAEGQAQKYAQVTVYGDGELVLSFGFTSERHTKLPSGKRYRTWEIEIRGTAPVYSVALATAVADLKDV